jgi:hypothetical protein
MHDLRTPGSFALPVVGTETRVNAANEANEFMIQYIESSPAVRYTGQPAAVSRMGVVPSDNVFGPSDLLTDRHSQSGPRRWN